MTEDPVNQKPQNPNRATLAKAIGCGLGAATGFAVYKLIGFQNGWLWMLIVIGGFLVQKIASK